MVCGGAGSDAATGGEVSRRLRVSDRLPAPVPDRDHRAERRRDDPPKQKLDRQYQAAVADYDAGRYAQAANELQHLLPYAPKSYELHELLGMVYVSAG